MAAFVIFISIIVLLQHTFINDFNLSSKEAIMNNNNTGIILLDRNNKPFYSFYKAKYRQFVPLSQIPQHAQLAVIASEDKDFYSHHGFSLKAIIRSMATNIEQKKLAYGGSTITQQLAKNTLLTSDRSFLRKIKEIILAYKIEQQYSKNEILEMYLNSVYFGQGAYGIEEASLKYFNKKALYLFPEESSFLIGLLPAPSKLSPISGNLELAKKKHEVVLQKMVEQKYISNQEKLSLQNKELSLNPQGSLFDFEAPHFAYMVRDELIKKYGEEKVASSGFTIKTSINLDWQKYAENTVFEQVEKLAGNRVSNGAVMVLDVKTGETKAVVGSYNFDNENFGKVNVALSLRQPGSSFKPIYYIAGFEKGIITPATLLKDQPITYGGVPRGGEIYTPHDYDGKFRGTVLARRALSNSLNIPSIEVLSKVGIKSALEMANRLGITTLNAPSRFGLSLALGTGEVRLLDLTSAYATFANYGKKISPTTILEIRDKQNQIIYNYHPIGKQVIAPEYTFLISSILSDNRTRAEVFGNSLDNNQQAAVKTGTTENYKDSWTIGYTPNLAIGAWVGNNDGAPMDNVAGSLGAAPIFKALIEKFSEGLPQEKFQAPVNISAISICNFNGLILKDTSSSSGYLEYFVKGSEPTQICYQPTPAPIQSGPTPIKLQPTPKP